MATRMPSAGAVWSRCSTAMNCHVSSRSDDELGRSRRGMAGEVEYVDHASAFVAVKSSHRQK